MGLFHESLNSFDDLFTHQLEDLYDAEHRILEALPLMADAAASSELKTAFNTHLLETRTHVQRLEQAFKLANKEAKRTTCPAMKGIVKEGSDTIGATGDPSVKDAALIASAQRVEHYEMAGYGTLRALAKQAGFTQIASLLQQTLDEEGAADKKLSKIAEQSINQQAVASR